MFKSLSDIIKRIKKTGLPFWEIILEDDSYERQVPKEESWAKMKSLYHEMKLADASYDKNLRSASNLAGGDGAKVSEALEKGEILSGPFMGEVIAKALKMAESNACMKRIVAAPTGGSCGVIPAVLITCEEKLRFSEDKMIEAMFVAAGIGQVIAERAFISGAEGGCQAEIGSASSMAAGAISYLKGGDGNKIIHAAALALKSMLGSTCDPVAGLVEIPCIKRNVMGAVNAVACADMACAGIISRIPPDEVIDAMRETGLALPDSLRETGKGGLAQTKTGKEIKNSIWS
ncbi:L-serine ammonia-lyase, iron-sulfur-dependent, subunit alpha [Mobilitalea sibirica]|uniref:L-serine dehydratase n=1 Tax=Mobilitalea sibirica TaxID=1462919 RepID=A0A8J7L1V9_9FIRM|nr:L-serine ammonia-lyase, iron-sulfur-dependent, subunit alpha [Mobilitalea sibirica]MBH1939323.1 L-serine ammonia-lyase, iron-sulfur-dependent, subunit alpha [Mobilitalea sibirica]